MEVRNPLSGTRWRIPRVMPGPMEGIMRGTFCEAVSVLGLVDAWMTPFIRIAVEVPGSRVLAGMLRHFRHRPLPLIVQLLGNDADKLARAAERLMHFDIAGIDLNFACPSKRVLQHDGGGALLAYPDRMNAILRKVRGVCEGISLSTKIRCGLESAEEMKNIIPAINDAGVDFITVHYRTVREFYHPVPGRSERLVEAVGLSMVPVFGSGDVYSPADAVDMVDGCGCAGVMAARGWLRDPLLIERIKGIDRGCDDGRTLVFGRMCELALEDPGKCWSRAGFMEIAAQMWGGGSRMFALIKSMDDMEIMRGEWMKR